MWRGRGSSGSKGTAGGRLAGLGKRQLVLPTARRESHLHVLVTIITLRSVTLAVLCPEETFAAAKSIRDNLGENSGDRLLRLLHAIWVGSGGRSDWSTWFRRWLPHVAVMRASDADLDWIWPGTGHDAIARDLFDRGVCCLIVTTAQGATAYTPAGNTTAASQRVDVVDTVGAGDSFCGGYLTRLHELGVATRDAAAGVDLDTWRDILDFAGRVAAVTVQRVGADPPRRAEVV